MASLTAFTFVPKWASSRFLGSGSPSSGALDPYDGGLLFAFTPFPPIFVIALTRMSLAADSPAKLRAAAALSRWNVEVTAGRPFCCACAS